ncbi:alpha/beta fold hydrolase [Nocardia sp. CDC159]|uniref:Alpha/beta fold hydrolase n=1 Tax=Nocardia pulmonis TaxID=2951408 RepID=A0A9X2EDK0_9NOCA|nr:MULTISPECIES: alpha/beta fold hydrolase [Nocardia]MCM6777465.1 alpha/beta fold hydrolase [Nocardia pulmonis]MCM6790428.1 alpha/beta fold hydrolase [Nocardia sp. CDC159]
MAQGVVEPEPRLHAGRGEPLLLVHGLLLTWQSWGAVADELASDYEVLAPTLPGHWGGPPARRPATIDYLADFLESLLDEFGWPTAHLAGNSLGGWLALELAARGRARSVTAIAPGGMWNSDPRAARRLIRKYRAFAPVIGIGAGSSVHPMVRSLVTPLLAHRPALVPHRLATAAALAPAHCTIVDDLAEDPTLPTGFTRFPDITTPITILFPAQDRLLPPRDHSHLPTHPILHSRTLPDVGHVPMLEAPTLITTEIRATTARSAPAATP